MPERQMPDLVWDDPQAQPPTLLLYADDAVVAGPTMVAVQNAQGTAHRLVINYRETRRRLRKRM